MHQPSPSKQNAPQLFRRRLDRALGEINALLVAIAIGLAALDFTCFVMLNTVAAIEHAPWVHTADLPAGDLPAAAPEALNTNSWHW